METGGDRNWTAHIVIACDHGGLRSHFQALEAELLHVLARVDEPKDIRDYLAALSGQSKMWFTKYERLHAKK